jgi:hypothetical protein
MALVQARHFVASAGTLSLQNGQFLTGAGGAGRSMIFVMM